MSRVFEAAALGAVGAGAGGAITGLDWLPLLSLGLTLLMFYAGRRDILERQQTALARVAEKVGRLEVDVGKAQEADDRMAAALSAHVARLATVEAEIHHRPTLSEMHAVVSARDDDRRRR